MNNDVDQICVVNRTDRMKRWYSSVALQNEAVVYTTAFGATKFSICCVRPKPRNTHLDHVQKKLSEVRQFLIILRAQRSGACEPLKYCFCELVTSYIRFGAFRNTRGHAGVDHRAINTRGSIYLRALSCSAQHVWN